MTAFIMNRTAKPGVCKIRAVGRCYKKPYASKAKANKFMRTWGKSHGAKSVYFCDRCDAWHLTSR